MIINKTMADRFWEGQDPIGQSVTLDFVPNEQPRVIGGGRRQRDRTLPTSTDADDMPHLQQQDRWQGPSWDYRAMMASSSAAMASRWRLRQRSEGGG